MFKMMIDDQDFLACFVGVSFDKEELLSGHSVDETREVLSYNSWEEIPADFFGDNQSIFNFATPSVFKFLTPAMISLWKDLEKDDVAAVVTESFCVTLTRELNPYFIDDLLGVFDSDQLGVIADFLSFLTKSEYPPMYLPACQKAVSEATR